jgi:transposase
MPKQPGSRETTPQLRRHICERAFAGQPLPEIALEFLCPLCTVQSIVKRGTERGNHENTPRSGRPSKIDDKALRYLNLSIHRDRRQSLQNITHYLNLTLPSPVTPETVSRVLNTRLGLSRRVAAKKPFLNAKQTKKRWIWAKDHIGWTVEDWKKVIWTDESSVEIGKESRRCTVWRKPGERYRKECLVPTFKSGRQSVMVWGCIAYGKQGPLVRIPSDKRKGADYVELIMQGPLQDFCVELRKEHGTVLVMEDGAPVHRSRVAKNFRSQNSMDSISHPPQSPDLNPIEHVWKKLKILVNTQPTRPRSVDELWVALQEEWERIDINFINSLVESMPRHAEALYNARGGSTKY